MKKSIILAAVAALVLAGCAKNETFVNVADRDAVNFGAYSGRTLTKAGCTDDMNLEALKKAEAGFGVFATYSGTADFTTANDNFMSNEKITWDGNTWSYSPVKYWPNMENGGDNYPEVTFYAYAPYVPYKPDEKVVEDTSYGIVELPTAGSPVIKYKVPDDPSKSVDLLYGVAAKDYNAGEYMGSSNNNVNLGASPIMRC